MTGGRPCLYAWHAWWARGHVAVHVPMDNDNIRAVTPEQAEAYARKLLKAAATARRHAKGGKPRAR